MTRLLEGELEAWTETEYVASPAGHAAVWAELRNKGVAARSVLVEFRAYGDGRARREVVVEPGDRLVVHVPVPMKLGNGELHVRPRGLAEGSTGVLMLEKPEGTWAVLGAPAGLDALVPGTPSADRADLTFYDAAHLPDVTTSLAGRRAVILLDDSAERLSRGQRVAIEQYALTGGEVIFAGDAAAGRPALDTWRADSGDSNGRFGFGRVRVLAKGLPTLDGASASLVRVRPQARQFDPSFATENGRFTNIRGGTLLGDVGRPPVVAFLTIILLFALAIGPGNIFVARRWGRHWVLVTIPALALVTCTGIGSYGVVADGLFTVHASAQAATVLDAKEGRAVTLAVTAVYAALAPGALRYPPGSVTWFGEGEERDLRVDWTKGPAYSGLVGARTLREIPLASVEPSRARLSLDGARVLNALGGAIVEGYASIDGRTVALGPAADGAEVPVGEGAPAVEKLAEPLQGRFSRDAITEFTRPLEPDEFVVQVQGAPFVPLGGIDPTWHAPVQLVRGRFTR